MGDHHTYGSTMDTYVPASVPLLLLLSLLPSSTDGCYRKPASVTTARPPMPTENPSHKLPCTAFEVAETQCLNRGECFAVLLNDGFRSTACKCTEQWEGDRCQFRSIDPEILEMRAANMRTAHIAAGVSVCILVVFVVLLAVFVFVRARKRNKSRRRDYESTRHPYNGRPSANGHHSEELPHTSHADSGGGGATNGATARAETSHSADATFEEMKNLNGDHRRTSHNADHHETHNL